MSLNIKKKRGRYRVYRKNFKREAVRTYGESNESYTEIYRLLDISWGHVFTLPLIITFYF